MKNAFAIVTFSGLLTACAITPGQHAEAPMQVAEQHAAATPAREGEDAAAPAAENLPNVKMSSAMLYQLMKAELEFRKGDWQGPYLTMLSLAQQTKDPRLARRAAEMAVAAKQADDALAAIKLWRELDPNSEEASQYYLGLVVMSDNIAPAEDILKRKIAEATPATRPLVLFQAEQLLLRAPDKKAGAEMLQRLVAPYSNMMEAHVVLSQAAMAQGDKAGALREAQAALSMKPDSEIAALTLAQALEDDDKVAEVLERFLKAHPDARDVRMAYARVLVNRKQYDAARGQFLTLLKAQPDNPATLYALGILSTQLNDSKAAEGYFTRFVDLVGNDPDEERDPTRALLILSQLAEDRGDLNAALAWLDKVQTAEPQAQLSASLRRAQLLGKKGDVEGARKLLATLKPEEPAAQAQVVMTESEVLRNAGRVLESFQLMQGAVQRFPNNTDLLYDFALLAEKVGKLDVMEKSLRAVIAQAPDNRHAYNALGYSLAERNVRLPEAYQLIDKALKMAPDDPFIMDSMGWVQYRMGNLKEAEAQLRKAYALRSDPEIAVHLGEVLWAQGRKADAQTLWREAKGKDPQNDTLRSTLERLHVAL
ncbi:tetratricopeptide repeat protein [Massilia solisilvae]|uniref:Tetratricopeptide repeat protein n=1 Tax=Massilia solisilvae TaxID=1811225 RepID=A0ABT2BQ83_9BURK|nr:tetratricopeptide repeat protein [Massilia solisilvae]MCS0610664.1 tetratricopeptide repeat protein [Massilia solisilvae]